MKSKTLCVILGESELIKYINFWNCGSRVKLSIVITSLYNTSLKSGCFWHSINLVLHTINCAMFAVGGGTGRGYLPVSIFS